MRSEDYAHLYALEESFWWFEGMRDITSALLDPVCLPARRRDILDAGCGTGGMLKWLERYADGGRIAGIDISPTALDFCRERRHKYLAQASVTELPFADSTFDLVTSFDVLVQVPGAGEDERAIREMYRVLRPGGVAFVRAAAYEWMRSGHDEALNTQRRYSLPLLKGSLERAGFRVTRGTYANSLLLPAAAIRRLVLKRVGLAASGSDVKALPPGLAWLNRTLTSALKAEAHFLKRPNRSLPAGLSTICVAEKPRADFNGEKAA